MMGLKIYLNQLWIELWEVQTLFLFISPLDWFLRLLCLRHWTDDQSDINQASWYKLIVKLDVTLWQHRPRSTLILTQGLSAPSCFLIGCTWYILGINLKYTRHMLSNILCIYSVHVLHITLIIIPCIFLVHNWYITSWPVYTWYIPSIYIVYFMCM